VQNHELRSIVYELCDFGLGTWHPKTGMFDMVQAMENLARELGVVFTNSNIEKIIVEGKSAKAIVVNGELYLPYNFGADYHHTETLLDVKHQIQKNIGTAVYLLHHYCFMFDKK
jgi:phytoene dehydrogenase-like protein